MSLATPGPPPATVEEAMKIVQAEFQYWNNLECGNDHTKAAMSIAAVGACANIFSAMNGLYAEWHPQPERKDGESFPTLQP